MDLDGMTRGRGRSAIRVPTEDEDKGTGSGGDGKRVRVESGKKGGIVEPALPISGAELREFVAGYASDLRQMRSPRHSPFPSEVEEEAMIASYEGRTGLARWDSSVVSRFNIRPAHEPGDRAAVEVAVDWPTPKIKEPRGTVLSDIAHES